MAAVLDELSGRLNCKPDEIAGRVEALQDEVKKLQTQLKKGAAGDLAGAADKLLAAAVETQRGEDHRRRDAGGAVGADATSNWTACDRRPAAPSW